MIYDIWYTYVHLTKDEEYTRYDPGLESVQPVCLWGVGGDGVEDVDEDQEQGHEESHPTLAGRWG